MQNRTFLVVLRPILFEKLKIAPPVGKQPLLKRLNFRFRPKNQSQNRWRLFFFFGDHLILGGKKRLNFRFRPKNQSQNRWRPFFFLFFFGDHLILGGKNVWISQLSEKFRIKFSDKPCETDSRNNENSGQGRLQTSHSFKIAPPPPPFSKSWLRAWQ